MSPAILPRLQRPLSLRPSVEVWTAVLGRRPVVVRRYPAPAPGSPWPPPPDPDVLAAVDHPSLVRFLLRCRDEEGVEWHVFARARGTTLRDLLRRGPLAPGRVVRCVRECAAGLDWLHRRCPAAPRLHGDVSTGNILVTPAGRARWLDVRAAPVLPSAPGGGPIVGTLPYLAPEVLGGASPLPASEVFSLGLVALAACVGPLPWSDAASPLEVLRARSFRVPRLLAATMPPPLSTLVAAMLNDPVALRPTAADVVAALRHVPDPRGRAGR